MSASTSALDMRNLKPINSEYIEQYIKAMLSVELECIEFRPTQEQLDESKANLRGVERFITRFGGIHSRYMVSNVYEAFYKLTLEQAKEIILAASKEMYG